MKQVSLVVKDEDGSKGNSYMRSTGEFIDQHWLGLQASSTEQRSSRKNPLQTKIMAGALWKAKQARAEMFSPTFADYFFSSTFCDRLSSVCNVL